MAFAWHNVDSQRRTTAPLLSNMHVPGIFQKDTCVDGSPDARIDDRHDYYGVTEHLWLESEAYRSHVLSNGEAVGMLFPCMQAFEQYKQELVLHGEKESLSGQSLFAQQIVPSCETQTAFLIRGDMIATAGHWPKGPAKAPCGKSDGLVVVFGLRIDDPQDRTSGAYVSGDQVKAYRIKDCLSWNHALNTSDYAVYRLECAVPDIVPVKLDLQHKAQIGDEIYSWGHPKGLPLKFVDDAQVFNRLGSKKTFRSPLDAMPGSSGSPVFNARSHKVVGILSGGVTTNYNNQVPRKVVAHVYHKPGCTCPQNGSTGVHFTRIWRVMAAGQTFDSLIYKTRFIPPCQ